MKQSRNFVLDKTPPKPPPPPIDTDSRSKKRKGGRGSKKLNDNSKKRKTTGGRRKTVASDEEEIIEITSDSEEDDGMKEDTQARSTTAPRRSTRTRKPVGTSYRDVDEDNVDMAEDIADGMVEDMTAQGMQDLVADEETAPPSDEVVVKDEETDPVIVEDSASSRRQQPSGGSPPDRTIIHIQDDEEEPKPKLTLQLKYQGFQIFGRCLCVIVEPWPPVRSASRAPSLAPMMSTTVRQTPSIAPPDFIPSGAGARRERTPLFLPDDDQDRGESPSITAQRLRTLPPVPLFNETPEDERQYESDDSEDGMMQLSQLLNTGRTVNGGVEEDDEYDGAFLFADADESREL